METWALANQKGGTGKTTTAIHLAAALAGQGKRCLLIDLDPQAHATLGLGIAVQNGRSIAAAFLDAAPLGDLIRATKGGFHLIPAEARLAEFEEVAERSLRPEGVLERLLAPLAARYDWVLLDCPPRADGVLTSNAIRAADTTLLVVETGAFALQGALRARALFEEGFHELEAAEGVRARPFDLRLCATLYEPASEISREFLVALHARFGPIMLDTVVRRDELLRAAVAYGVPALELDPEARPAQDFDSLAREVLGVAARRRTAGTVTAAPEAPLRAARRVPAPPSAASASRGEDPPPDPQERRRQPASDPVSAAPVEVDATRPVASGPTTTAEASPTTDERVPPWARLSPNP